jgi:trigger factor
MEVTVEVLAPCKKKLSISIPPEDVKAKFEERYKELEKEAQVPGFRPGRAPRRLVEKRFHEAVAEEVRAKLVAEAFEKAVKDQNLDVIGEPNIDPEAIKVPDEGPMVFSIELEVRPEFELPDYAGIPVSAERPAVTEEAVTEALERARESFGRIEPAGPEGEARQGDIVTCDLTIQAATGDAAGRAGQVMVVDRQGVRLPVAAIAVSGIRLDNLPELLTGAKVGETRSARITISGDAEREDVRGKEAEVRVKIGRIERVALPDNLALLKATDYEDMDALRAGVRRQVENQSEAAYRRAQEKAVQDWLLERIPLDLPAELSKRHANRLLQRQLLNLQYRGIPPAEIERHLEEIRGISTEVAARDLKLFFILDAIAKKEKIEVTDAEVDARIRMIAQQYNRRDDRLREEMEEQGTLESLRGQIVEDKVLDLLLSKANISTPDAEAKPTQAPAQDQVKAEETPGQAKPAEGAAPGQVEST